MLISNITVNKKCLDCPIRKLMKNFNYKITGSNKDQIKSIQEHYKWFNFKKS